MVSLPKLSLNGVPEPLLDALISSILNVCPTLTSTFLHEVGSRVHTSTAKAIFSTLQIPDDARYFLENTNNQASLLSSHPLSAVLCNPTRYAHIVKKIVVNEAELPSISWKDAGALGLITIHEDDEESDDEMVTTRNGRIAVQPMRAQDLISLLTLCGNLESFVWKSSSPPPDGICEVVSEQCPKLSGLVFQPDAPLRAASVPKTSLGLSPPLNRPQVVKWDAPSLRLLSNISLTQLHITRLSLSGSQALTALFEQLGEESFLEDVNLNLIWFEGLCEQLVKAGRRIRKLHLGTSGTKLADKDIILIFEGCESLEDFALSEAEARFSRQLWSKIKSFPPRLQKFTIAISESGPHHSWICDHLESFPSLKLNTITHLSIKRILPLPRLAVSGTELEYDPNIDNVALLRPIPSEIAGTIREMSSLVSLRCDWWSWKLDDLKGLAESCTKLEYLEIALDAPFTKLLSTTSTFALMTKLCHLAVCIPPVHSPGLVPPLLSPFKATVHPLTPAASPVRRRTSLPSPVSDFASQVFVGEDYKPNEQVDISFPPTREVKKFVKKCPKLYELEWYGRNARGRWLISRTQNGSSKLSPNVSVEYIPPIAPLTTWNRATLEQATLDFVTSGGGCLPYDIPREGQAWTGPKAEEFKKDLENGKEKITSVQDKIVNPPGKRGRISTSSSSSDGSGVSVQVKNNVDTVNIGLPLSPISPSPLSLSEPRVNDSTVKVPVSPTQSMSCGTATESHIRTEGNEGHRSRRPNFSGSNAFSSTPPRRHSSAAPSKISACLESKNTNSAGVNVNNNATAGQSQHEGYTRTHRERGNGFFSHAPSRRGGFGRGGGNSKRGAGNDRPSNARQGFTSNGPRRGNAVPT